MATNDYPNKGIPTRKPQSGSRAAAQSPTESRKIEAPRGGQPRGAIKTKAGALPMDNDTTTPTPRRKTRGETIAENMAVVKKVRAVKRQATKEAKALTAERNRLVKEFHKLDKEQHELQRRISANTLLNRDTTNLKSRLDKITEAKKDNSHARSGKTHSLNARERKIFKAEKVEQDGLKKVSQIREARTKRATTKAEPAKPMPDRVVMSGGDILQNAAAGEVSVVKPYAGSGKFREMAKGVVRATSKHHHSPQRFNSYTTNTMKLLADIDKRRLIYEDATHSMPAIEAIRRGIHPNKVWAYIRKFYNLDIEFFPYKGLSLR